MLRQGGAAAELPEGRRGQAGTREQEGRHRTAETRTKVSTPYPLALQGRQPGQMSTF